MKMLQLRCPNCDAVLDLKDDMGTQCFCNYCGTKILLDEQQESIVNAKVRIQELEYKKYKIDKKYEDKNKERKSENMVLLIFPILLVISMSMLYINSYVFRTIPVPYSASDFCKMDCDAAIEILESAGFQNITATEQAANGLFKSKETKRVNSISIDGKPRFRAGNEFRPKAPIVIIYNP